MFSGKSKAPLGWQRLTIIPLALVFMATSVIILTPRPTSAQGSPTIWAEVDTGWVGGYDYEPGSQVTVSVYESPEGPLLRTATATVDETGQFGAGEAVQVDAKPGNRVEITDGLTTKVLDVVNVSLDTMNSDTNIASGTGPADSQVYVELNSNENNLCTEGKFYEGSVSTNAEGVWSLDLTTVGGDIFPLGQWGQVSASDEDGDSSRSSFHMRDYRAYLQSDLIAAEWLGWWDANSTVTVKIYAVDGTKLYEGEASTTKYGEFSLSYDAHGVDLRPGMQVVVSDSRETIATTLLAVTWDTLNLTTGIATGTAPAGSLGCAMGELIFDEANSDAGKGLWPLNIDDKGSWWIDLTGPLPPESWGNIGFGRTFAPYWQPDQAIRELSGVVTLLMGKGDLTPVQGAVLHGYLNQTQAALTESKPKEAHKALKDFQKQVEDYLKAGQLSAPRAGKLIGDADMTIITIKEGS